MRSKTPIYSIRTSSQAASFFNADSCVLDVLNNVSSTVDWYRFQNKNTSTPTPNANKIVLWPT